MLVVKEKRLIIAVQIVEIIKNVHTQAHHARAQDI